MKDLTSRKKEQVRGAVEQLRSCYEQARSAGERGRSLEARHVEAQLLRPLQVFEDLARRAGALADESSEENPQEAAEQPA